MSLLEVASVAKRFSGIHALDNVSLTVDSGELVGLIGPNGAGKTTLFNCMCGVYPPDRGHISFDGHDLRGVSTYRRARLGIGRTFQRMELFGGMTVRDHLIVARRAHARRGGVIRDLTLRSKPTESELAAAGEALELLGLDNDAERHVEVLSLGRGRLVELARALVTEPRLLLLDEPSSGLDTHETAEMSEVLERVNAERGTAIVLVEHDLTMVRRVARRLVCLDLGTVIAEGPTADVLALPAVRAAYLGETA